MGVPINHARRREGEQERVEERKGARWEGREERGQRGGESAPL